MFITPSRQWKRLEVTSAADDRSSLDFFSSSVTHIKCGEPTFCWDKKVINVNQRIKEEEK